MCGIVGYVGGRQAYPILIKGLTRLEYRGYDSAGVALIGDSGELVVYKTKGKVKDLEAAAADKDTSGSIGIAHTRWATHGEPSDVNSHPHYSENHQLALIHNGIIENYQALKTELTRKGYHFQSQTDTEVVIQLIQYMMDSRHVSFDKAVPMALNHVVGAYALVIMDKNQPDKLIAARKGSPLIIGVGEDEYFVGSDASPIIEYTHKVVYLGEEQIAHLHAELKDARRHLLDVGGKFVLDVVERGTDEVAVIEPQPAVADGNHLLDVEDHGLLHRGNHRVVLSGDLDVVGYRLDTSVFVHFIEHRQCVGILVVALVAGQGQGFGTGNIGILEGERFVATLVATMILMGVAVVFFAADKHHRSYRHEGNSTELQNFFHILIVFNVHLVFNVHPTEAFSFSAFSASWRASIQSSMSPSMKAGRLCILQPMRWSVTRLWG